MRFLVVAALLSVPLFTSAAELAGKVIKVTDGDTVTILTAAKKQERIRLLGIDAPEKRQAFGQRSKQSLSELVAGKTVSVDWNKRDRYKRIVGKILLNGHDVNLEQVKRGMAWHYKAYEREQEIEDRSVYAQAEYQAQKGETGLWLDANPLAPWVFRKR